MLQWDLPTDNEGESISHYIITGSPNLSEEITEDMSLSITDLLPNTEYKFTISANNSVGFGNNTSINCTTLGESKKRKL